MIEPVIPRIPCRGSSILLTSSVSVPLLRTTLKAIVVVVVPVGVTAKSPASVRSPNSALNLLSIKTMPLSFTSYANHMLLKPASPLSMIMILSLTSISGNVADTSDA